MVILDTQHFLKQQPYPPAGQAFCLRGGANQRKKKKFQTEAAEGPSIKNEAIILNCSSYKDTLVESRMFLLSVSPADKQPVWGVTPISRAMEEENGWMKTCIASPLPDCLLFKNQYFVYISTTKNQQKHWTWLAFG